LKAHSLPGAAKQMQPLLGPETAIVSAVNGIPWWYFYKLPGAHEDRRVTSVDPDGTVGELLHPSRAIGCIVYPAAEVPEPGVIEHTYGDRFTLGEPDGSRSPRIEALSQAMMRAGFKSPVSKDIRSEIWVKLWGNLSFNPISALTHATLEDICRYPLSRELAATMMREAQAVGEKLGVQFKVTLDQRIAGAEAVGAHKTSMLQDVEHGRALELEALVGSVVELGRITETPTPTISAIYAAASLLNQTLAGARGRLQVQPAG
jgi:2-dehydropantoate 2-reductase